MNEAVLQERLAQLGFAVVAHKLSDVFFLLSGSSRTAT